MGFRYNDAMPSTPQYTLTRLQRDVVIGTLLGDSSLSRPKTGKNFHLACYHAIAQRDWLVKKHDWLGTVARPIHWCAYLDKRDGKTRHGGRFHTLSIPAFTELAAVLYPNGRKVITPEYLNQFREPISLACLICDDGSWDGAGIAIATKQFSRTENELIAEHLRRTFGLSVSLMANQKYPYIRITAASVQRARDLCFPFCPDGLKYKFGDPSYQTRLVGKVTKICRYCEKPFSTYESSGERFCSQRCGAKGRTSGYATRTTTAMCERCGNQFTPYSRRNLKCKSCQGMLSQSKPCEVCGSPVWFHDQRTCSRRCGVTLGHRDR